jgi:hypothetical protein
VVITLTTGERLRITLQNVCNVARNLLGAIGVMNLITDITTSPITE